jgi:hypothetical protein
MYACTVCSLTLHYRNHNLSTVIYFGNFLESPAVDFTFYFMEHDSTVYPYLYEQNKALHIGSMNTALKEDLSPRKNQREGRGGVVEI